MTSIYQQKFEARNSIKKSHLDAIVQLTKETKERGGKKNLSKKKS